MRGVLWLTWRQQRAAVLVALAALAVGAAGVSWGHAGTVAAEASDWFRACAQHTGACDFTAAARFEHRYVLPLEALAWVVVVLPLLVGVFWGAPLLGRDAELGTHRLVLSQDLGRTRWFLWRFGVAAGFTLVLATGLVLLFSWWRNTLVAPLSGDTKGLDWYDPAVLDASGPRAVAACLFGLAAGTALGLVLRRVLPAMVGTLVAVAAVQGVLTLFRRTFVPPHTYVSEGTAPRVPLGDKWSYGDWGYLTASGRHESIMTCPVSGAELKECMGRHGFVGRYYLANPRGDFWTFQWVDTGVFLVLTAALLALTAWLLHRRRV